MAASVKNNCNEAIYCNHQWRFTIVENVRALFESSYQSDDCPPQRLFHGNFLAMQCLTRWSDLDGTFTKVFRSPLRRPLWFPIFALMSQSKDIPLGPSVFTFAFTIFGRHIIFVITTLLSKSFSRIIRLKKIFFRFGMSFFTLACCAEHLKELYKRQLTSGKTVKIFASRWPIKKVWKS